MIDSKCNWKWFCHGKQYRKYFNEISNAFFFVTFSYDYKISLWVAHPILQLQLTLPFIPFFSAIFTIFFNFQHSLCELNAGTRHIVQKLVTVVYQIRKHIFVYHFNVKADFFTEYRRSKVLYIILSDYRADKPLHINKINT